eukprot:Skav214234  [mRNA]  locus=scaffold1133:90679:92782:+ [translate_table: standard]
MSVPVVLEPTVFQGFAAHLSRRCLQVCAASCRQSLDQAFASDVWQAVDLAHWRPLDGHVEPGDLDLMLALKRVPSGRLRSLVLQSRRISNDGLRKILMMQSQLEELVMEVTKTHLGGDCALTGDVLVSSTPKLRRLEVLGVAMTSPSEGPGGSRDRTPSLESLVLHLPTLRDLEAVPALTTLKMLEVFPPAISFNSLGHLLPEAQPFNDALLKIFKSCQDLRHLRLWGYYILDTPMLQALCKLPNLEELHGYCLQARDVISGNDVCL